MKIKDMVNHLTRLLSVKTGKKVYVEQIGDLIEDCLYVEIISSNRITRSTNLEEFKIKFDVKYYHSRNGQSNVEVFNMLDNINDSFDMLGVKTLKVLDRFVVLENVNQTIVDGVGHYAFDLKLLVEYGSKYQYELMQELKYTLDNKEV